MSKRQRSADTLALPDDVLRCKIMREFLSVVDLFIVMTVCRRWSLAASIERDRKVLPMIKHFVDGSETEVVPDQRAQRRAAAAAMLCTALLGCASCTIHSQPWHGGQLRFLCDLLAFDRTQPTNVRVNVISYHHERNGEQRVKYLCGFTGTVASSSVSHVSGHGGARVSFTDNHHVEIASCDVTFVYRWYNRTHGCHQHLAGHQRCLIEATQTGVFMWDDPLVRQASKAVWKWVVAQRPV